MNHFESRLLLAPHCPVCGWTRQPPIGACRSSTAHDAIYASVQEERARPTYQRVLHPRANTGVRRSKVEGVLKSFFFLCLLLLLLKIISSPQTRGLGQSPESDQFFGAVRRTFKVLVLNHD